MLGALREELGARTAAELGAREVRAEGEGKGAGGEAETWCEVAGVRLQEGGLTHTGDSTQAQLRFYKGLTDEVRFV